MERKIPLGAEKSSTGEARYVTLGVTALGPLGIALCRGQFCSSLINPKGSPICDEGQASIEWKTGLDRRRAPLALGFEQNPCSGMLPSPWATRRGPAPSWFSRWGIDRFVTGVAPAHHSLRRVFNTCSSVVRNCPAITSRDSGMTRIWPTTLMKFVSPCHLGTRWAWRCSGTPAPAARP